MREVQRRGVLERFGVRGDASCHPRDSHVSRRRLERDWYEDCIVRGMSVMPTRPVATHEAVSASLRVVESAIALARAETKLALVRGRELAAHAIALLLGGLVAMTFLALTLVIVSLSPVSAAPSAALRVAWLPLPWPFLLSLSASVAITVAGTWVAIAAFRRLKSVSAADETGERT